MINYKNSTYKTCHECGKKIDMSLYTDYGYKKDGHIFCGHTCLMKYYKRVYAKQIEFTEKLIKRINDYNEKTNTNEKELT